MTLHQGYEIVIGNWLDLAGSMRFHHMPMRVLTNP